MMTSAADTPSPLWMPVGMPRPLSQTVTEPSGLSVTRDLVGMAGKRLVDAVVDDLVHHVVQAGAVVGVADVHARALANRIEALEDLDRFGAVVAIALGDRFHLVHSGFRLRVGGRFPGPQTDKTSPVKTPQNQRLLYSIDEGKFRPFPKNLGQESLAFLRP